MGLVRGIPFPEVVGVVILPLPLPLPPLEGRVEFWRSDLLPGLLGDGGTMGCGCG